MTAEIFSLQSQELEVKSLWTRDPVELWSAGAAIGAAPASFATQEGNLFLVRGRLRLDSERLLEGPALVVLDPGLPLGFEALDANVRLLLWSIRSQQQRSTASPAPRVLDRRDFEQPRTITTAASLVHWLPLQDAPARRTLA